MLSGANVGFAQAGLFRSNAAGTAYVLGLEAVQVTAGVLCLGLIRPWGERVPRWVPRLGGREIPRRLPLVVGGTGNALLYLINGALAVRFGTIWLGLAEGWTPAEGMNRWQVAVLVAAYAPMILLWAPALTVGLDGTLAGEAGAPERETQTRPRLSTSSGVRRAEAATIPR